MSDSNVFGERLRSLRDAAGMTQADLADAIQSGMTTIRRWEKGQTVPDVRQLQQLCELFDCEPGYFLGMQDAPKRADADVMKYTGLSEETVKELHELKGDYLKDPEEVLAELVKRFRGSSRENDDFRNVAERRSKEKPDSLKLIEEFIKRSEVFGQQIYNYYSDERAREAFRREMPEKVSGLSRTFYPYLRDHPGIITEGEIEGNAFLAKITEKYCSSRPDESPAMIYAAFSCLLKYEKRALDKILIEQTFREVLQDYVDRSAILSADNIRRYQFDGILAERHYRLGKLDARTAERDLDEKLDALARSIFGGDNNASKKEHD